MPGGGGSSTGSSSICAEVPAGAVAGAAGGMVGMRRVGSVNVWRVAAAGAGPSDGAVAREISTSREVPLGSRGSFFGWSMKMAPGGRVGRRGTPFVRTATMPSIRRPIPRRCASVRRNWMPRPTVTLPSSRTSRTSTRRTTRPSIHWVPPNSSCRGTRRIRRLPSGSTWVVSTKAPSALMSRMTAARASWPVGAIDARRFATARGQRLRSAEPDAGAMSLPVPPRPPVPRPPIAVASRTPVSRPSPCLVRRIRTLTTRGRAWRTDPAPRCRA